MKNICVLPFRTAAILFLRIALPYLVIISLAVLIRYLQLHTVDPIEANFLCRPWLEYLVGGIVIATGGACLIDYIERSANP